MKILYIPISYKIGMMVIALSSAIFLIFYLYHHFVNNPLLLKNSEIQIKEIGELFKSDIEIMLSFEDDDGMNDILNRVTSLKSILGIAVSKNGNINFQKGLFDKNFLEKRDREIYLNDEVFIYNFQIELFQITLLYSAERYIERVETYGIFSIALFTIISVFASIFFLSIRRIFLFFENLSQKLQEIDFGNFKPIELDSIQANDERQYILKGVKSLLLKVQKEITNSREKDRVMFQQARLAQMGEMIGNIAHQWRQPLNEISLLIQSFEIAFYRNKIDEDFIEKRLDESEKIIDKMSQTIDDFREFFNPNKEKNRFSINSSIQEAIKLIEISFQTNSIEIEQKFDQDILFFGFQNEFEQVILNLLSNSKDVLLNSDEKLIYISLQKTQTSIKISISDTGGGVKEENIDHIFEPYFTTKEQGKGTGIGLYMSKSIIKNMGGDIDIRNIEKGAEFRISLPRFHHFK